MILQFPGLQDRSRDACTKPGTERTSSEERSLHMRRPRIPFVRRKPAPPATTTPEFGTRITLHKGDKIVRRGRDGVIRITKLTEDDVDGIAMRRSAP